MRSVPSRFAAAIALLATLAPAPSRAQSAPSAPTVAPPAHVGTAQQATPQAGRQVPVPTATTSSPPTAPPYAPPFAPRYVPPFAPAYLPGPVDAQPLFPPRKKIRSVGSIIGGSVLATIGSFPLIGGLVITAQGTDEGIDYAAVGVPMASIGAVMVGGGVALIVWGSGEEWACGDEAAAIPTVRVGATSASAQWAF